MRNFGYFLSNLKFPAVLRVLRIYTYPLLLGTILPYLHLFFTISYVSHVSRFTSEQPLWELFPQWRPPLSYLCAPLPIWSRTTYLDCLHLTLAVLPLFWLTEGAWWTYFRWFRLLPRLPSLILTAYGPYHQPDRWDVRFYLPITLDVRLTGWNLPLTPL